ncbi:uncharacterized protein YALI1_B00719g [Yarrowia lipolytica]|uniref:Uncharacterized protein n=1 Tax=Yarrowia lipolytica TaxID=4952 RepID=A0A1D8N5U6_YARLL|nr:hypothetical protein YALI1_B00719g [Yarrowia lipolytica]
MRHFAFARLERLFRPRFWKVVRRSCLSDRHDLNIRAPNPQASGNLSFDISHFTFHIYIHNAPVAFAVASFCFSHI